MAKEQKESDNQYTWTPSLTWLLKTLIIIYIIIIVAYFSLNILLKPYMRDIPIELTPWLADKVTMEQK